MHSFNREELAIYLARHVPGFTTLDAMDKFTGGRSNPTYLLRSGGRRFVLRAKPPGALLASAHQVDREFRAMRALAVTQVPVPAMLHLSAETSPLGPQFFVMEHVAGTVHWDPALPGIARDARAEVYDAMNATLAELHGLDPAALGLGDFGKPGSYFGRQLSRWEKQYRAAAPEPLPDVEWVMAWLKEAMPEDDGQVSIVHGDFRIDNMIFDTRNRVVALLDWELSTLGHPLADLAYQVMVWRLSNAGTFKGLGGVDRAASGLPSDADYLATYADRRCIHQPGNWAFYLCFAAFRFLAILEGVRRREEEGNASNPARGGVLKEMIETLAQEARAIARH